MMKKIMLVVFLFAMLSGYSAYADFEGDYLAHNTMDGQWSMFYDDGQTSEISDEEAHSGSKSLKYSIDATDNFQVNTNLAEITGNEKLYYKLYIKNRPNVATGVVICAYTGNETNNMRYRHDLVLTGTTSDGWEEFSLALTPEGDATNTKIFIQVLKTVDLNLPIYFDDITIQKVPYNIEFKNAIVRDSDTLKLDALQLKGYNKQNEERICTNSSDFTTWKVIDGDAIVDDANNLYYTGDATGTVTVEGNYLGVKAQAEITFNKDVGVTLGSGGLNVTNSKAEPIDVSIVTTLFDDNNKLYKFVIDNVSVPTGGMDIAIKDIVKPYFINNNKLKVFVVADGNIKTFEIAR